ncbi:hypothetical protein [Thioalkalivibrio sp. HK1]|uniref:hypothetical protein n=1 Tax=Thioalkalivibrio sp. HK1 TaxID=1469245 RepID=UPI0012DF5AA3|nr:hypothetical protein [Thioalkalivibrio sp. HK1]
MNDTGISSPYRQAIITIPKPSGMPAEGIEKKRRQRPWFDIDQLNFILLKIRFSLKIFFSFEAIHLAYRSWLDRDRQRNRQRKSEPAGLFDKKKDGIFDTSTSISDDSFKRIDGPMHTDTLFKPVRDSFPRTPFGISLYFAKESRCRAIRKYRVLDCPFHGHSIKAHFIE